jgi:hypothetical protein
MTVKHCPTEQMLADFFTKPLQGSLFRKFRDVVMGHKHIDSLKTPMPTPSQERVGKDNLIKIVRNGPDGQTTDKNVSEPTIRTYAEAVKAESAGSVKTNGLKKGKAIRMVTFKK